MSFEFYVNMQKREDGKIYSDLHKTDRMIYFYQDDAQKAIDKDPDLKACRHVVKMIAEVAEDVENENSRLRQLLISAQKALSTCKLNYSECNQFEGNWTAEFSETEIQEALKQINQELGLPPPKKLRES